MKLTSTVHNTQHRFSGSRDLSCVEALHPREEMQMSTCCRCWKQTMRKCPASESTLNNMSDCLYYNLAYYYIYTIIQMFGFSMILFFKETHIWYWIVRRGFIRFIQQWQCRSQGSFCCIFHPSISCECPLRQCWEKMDIVHIRIQIWILCLSKNSLASFRLAMFILWDLACGVWRGVCLWPILNDVSVQCMYIL